jgi:LmbE family N-acetylglucosaminyl deacetylase
MMESKSKTKSVAVIVAHPDDETLWAGGTFLSHPTWDLFILSLCRGSDPDRAPKFFQTLQILGADGRINDLDDGPEQNPLAKCDLEAAIIQALPDRHFDLLISHSPAGEYTRHRRHEEVGEAVISLWRAGKLQANKLWTFAYEDGKKHYYPRPIKTAHIYQDLQEDIWQKKYDIITTTYGFPNYGFEAETTPRAEAFWHFANPDEAQKWLMNKVFQYESSPAL